jgi:hypothetical protein
MTNNKRKLQVAPPIQPQNIAAQVVITAFTDKPPSLSSSTTLPDTIQLIAVGLSTLAESIKQQSQPNQAQVDQVDKPREYLGPRKN